MKFGQVPNPEVVDFTIPPDHKHTKAVLARSKAKDLKIHVGCAKWNKTDLKGFYPKGTKDELGYYSTQFNCIELNATFYRLFPPATFEKWYATAPEGFKFFPKLEQTISHFRRLKDVKELVENNVTNMSHLQEKLGMPFLQMHNNFGPKDMDRVVEFVENWKQYKSPLAMEFRHTDWYNDPKVSSQLYSLLETNKITNVLVDTAGRRDLMHTRLTTPNAFIRWVGANDPKSDRSRLDDWVNRIADWKAQGLKELNFFVHQNIEKESPLLSAYFIEKLNKKLGTNLAIPKHSTRQMVTLVRTDAGNDDFRSLVVSLDEELRQRDGEDHYFFAQFNKLAGILGVVVAYLDDRAVGCGGFKENAHGIAEIKRMFVSPESRGKRIAASVLKELETWAAELNYTECILETGFKQPEAIALYKREGYETIPNYGQYADVATSVCMMKKVG